MSSVWNFINESNDVSDDNGHGTAMAGIIAAQTGNGIGMAGVMWQAGIMPLKALDATGSGAISDVVEAMDYARSNSATVINCSFGTPAMSTDPSSFPNAVWVPSRIDYPNGENYRFYYTSYVQMWAVEKWTPPVGRARQRIYLRLHVL